MYEGMIDFGLHNKYNIGDGMKLGFAMLWYGPLEQLNWHDAQVGKLVESFATSPNSHTEQNPGPQYVCTITDCGVHRADKILFLGSNIWDTSGIAAIPARLIYTEFPER